MRTADDIIDNERNTITRFCRFANSVDSAVDMPRDSRKNEIKCIPSFVNMATMIVSAIPDIFVSMGQMKLRRDQLIQMFDFGRRTLSGYNR